MRPLVYVDIEKAGERAVSGHELERGHEHFKVTLCKHLADFFSLGDTSAIGHLGSDKSDENG
jgi:hypothetical protein